MKRLGASVSGTTPSPPITETTTMTGYATRIQTMGFTGRNLGLGSSSFRAQRITTSSSRTAAGSATMGERFSQTHPRLRVNGTRPFTKPGVEHARTSGIRVCAEPTLKTASTGINTPAYWLTTSATLRQWSTTMKGFAGT